MEQKMQHEQNYTGTNWTERRLLRMITLREQGLTYKQIANRFRLTGERVRQILKTYEHGPE